MMVSLWIVGLRCLDHVRVSGVTTSITRHHCALVLVVATMLLAPLRWSSYNSLIAFISALGLFLVFEKAIPRHNVWQTWLARGACGILTFAVYFLHLSGFGMYAMCKLEGELAAVLPPLVAAIIATLVSFFACLAIDVVRNALIYALCHPLNMFMKWIDACHEKIRVRWG